MNFWILPQSCVNIHDFAYLLKLSHLYHIFSTCIPLNGQISITSNIFSHLLYDINARDKTDFAVDFSGNKLFDVSGTHIVVYTAFRSLFSIAALFVCEALEPHWNSIQTRVYVAVLICSFYGEIHIFFLYFEQRKMIASRKKNICQVQPPLKNSKGATITHNVHIDHNAAFTMSSRPR